MATFYHDDHEPLPWKEGDDDAPEAVNRLSPVASRSNIEGELQKREYSLARGYSQRVPIDHDTEKEVVAVAQERMGMEAHIVSPVEPATATSPRTLWRQETEDFPTPGVDDTGKEAMDRRTHNGPTSDRRRILGMKRNVFIVVMTILVLLIVAGAIGGGVGGSLANKSQEPTKTSNNSGTSTTTGSASSYTTPAVSFLNNETWPKGGILAFQGFARFNFTGMATQIVTGDGGKDFAVDFPYDLHSYVWIPNNNNCCINFCTNSTKAGKIGYLCNPKMQHKTSQPLSRVFIWCSDVQNDETSDAKGCAVGST